MSTIQLEYESVPTIEGETIIMVIAWDVATHKPLHAGRLVATAQWLDLHGYDYVTGTNGMWSNGTGIEDQQRR